MHEYAVTESMLEIIQAEAVKAGASHVGEVTVVLGELSSFVDESIEFYFSELSRGTIAEGARLVFQKVEARADCSQCGESFRPRQIFYSCPRCGSPAVELIEGQEMYIDSIDVETGAGIGNETGTGAGGDSS
ncbi:MAG: hydrogenase maturation nickel metallochaperone HypA [Thermoleophilia bacterium]